MDLSKLFWELQDYEWALKDYLPNRYFDLIDSNFHSQSNEKQLEIIVEMQQMITEAKKTRLIKEFLKMIDQATRIDPMINMQYDRSFLNGILLGLVEASYLTGLTGDTVRTIIQNAEADYKKNEELSK